MNLLLFLKNMLGKSYFKNIWQFGKVALQIHLSKGTFKKVWIKLFLIDLIFFLYFNHLFKFIENNIFKLLGRYTYPMCLKKL